MAKDSNLERSDEGREPNWRLRADRGAKGRQSVSARLARLRGGRPKRTSGGGGGARHGGSKGRGAMPYGATNERSQRVVVKVVSHKHGASKKGGSSGGAKALAKHVSYLSRDSASADGERGVFYSAREDAVNAQALTQEWNDDPHHFRVIISPENASDIADMRGYVRSVMERVERDMNTPIEWAAINHHNTDNPHAHVLVRGADKHGDELFIRREYVANGFRARASEAATELLGPRSEKEVQNARTKEVEAHRFTSLDRTIERSMKDGVFDASTRKRIGFRRADRALVIGRLQHLEQMGLAEKGRGTNWRLDPHFKRTLMEAGARNDIIKQLHGSLGKQAAQVRHDPIRQPVAGRVVAKGAVDEINEQRFVVVRDSSNTMRYAKVADGPAYRKLKIGDQAELGRAAHSWRQAAQQVLEVAKTGGEYSTQEHERRLLTGNQGNADAALQWARTVGRQVETWAGRSDSGIERTKRDGVYQVDRRKFERFTQRQQSRSVTDVRSLTVGRERTKDRGQDTGRE